MTENETIAVIAVSGVAISALCVLSASIFAFLGQNKRLDDLRQSVKELSDEFKLFNVLVNGKLSTIDNEIGNILDKLPK